MSQHSNPLSAAAPWDLVADGYAVTTSIMLAQYADEAVKASMLKPAAHILDVACGPGALAIKLASAASCVYGIDFSASMLNIFKREVVRMGISNIFMQQGDAQILPYADNQFDAAFSMFGLMFFPDRRRGFAEMYRTLKTGGTIAVTSWGPIDESPAMQIMFGALRVMKPDLPEPQRSIGSLENPDVFRQEMQEAGFREVKIQRVTKAVPVITIPDFWEAMVKGSAPIQMLKNGMGIDVWREKEKLALNFLHERLPNTPTELSSDAWLGIAIK